ELAQFIQSIDPKRTQDITARLESYRELHSMTMSTSTSAVSTEIDRPVDVHSQPTMVSGQHTITLSAPRSALLGLILVGVLSVLGAGGVLWWARAPLNSSGTDEGTGSAVGPAVNMPSERAEKFPTEAEPPRNRPSPTGTTTKATQTSKQSRTRPAQDPEAVPASDATIPEAPTESAPPSAEPSAADPEDTPSDTSATVLDGTGFLYLSSHPHGDGFEVWLDSELLGPTPLKRKELPVGTHTLRIVDPGSSQSWSVEATIEKNQKTKAQVPP
ncbi:MAG: PEGA domain-containing protein, partial [Myxococcota bacterium]|nr:PEGA domain-containing protein [Myxococcota bacterium]